MRPLSFLDEQFDRDPWPIYARFRAESPVWWSKEIGMYCLFRYRECQDALLDGRFTTEYPFRISQQVFGRTLLDMDGEEHRRGRALTAKLFSREAIETIVADELNPILNEVFKTLKQKEEFDFVSEVASVVPLHLTCRLLGISRTQIPTVEENLSYLLRHLDGSSGVFEEVSRRRRALETHLKKACETGVPILRRTGLQEMLTDEDTLRMMMLLLAAGVETSVCSLSNVLYCLLTHDEWSLESRGNPQVLHDVIRESLRWEPPQHDTVRFTRESTTLGGVPIEKGRALKVILASANRDEERFERPEEFMPHRAEKALLSFGQGPHGCLGRLLATRQLEKIFGRLLDDSLRIEAQLPHCANIVGRTFRRPVSLPIKVRWR